MYKDLIEDLLEQWGASAKEGTVKLNYKLGVLGRIKGSTVKSASISFDDYMLIDEAVSQLKALDRVLHEVLTRVYIERKTRSQVSRELKISPAMISQHKAAGITFVAGYVNKNIDG